MPRPYILALSLGFVMCVMFFTMKALDTSGKASGVQQAPTANPQDTLEDAYLSRVRSLASDCPTIQQAMTPDITDSVHVIQSAISECSLFVATFTGKLEALRPPPRFWSDQQNMLQAARDGRTLLTLLRNHFLKYGNNGGYLSSDAFALWAFTAQDDASTSAYNVSGTVFGFLDDLPNDCEHDADDYADDNNCQ